MTCLEGVANSTLKNLSLSVWCSCSEALVSWRVKFTVKDITGRLFVGTLIINNANVLCEKNVCGVEEFIPLVNSLISVSSLYAN